MTSFREMCETIERAGIVKKRDGALMTAREIFEYSPTGESAAIPMWYYQALDVLGEPNPLDVDELPPNPADGDYVRHEGVIKIWTNDGWRWKL